MSPRQIIFFFLPYFKPHWLQLGLSFMSMLLVTAVHLARPMVLRGIIDDAIVNGSIKLAMAYAAAFLGLLAIGASAMYYRIKTMAIVGARITAQIKSEAFSHILSQGMGFFDNNAPGRLISRTESDVDQIKSLFTHEAMQVFSSVLLIVATICYIFYESQTVGFIALGSMALVILLIYSYLSYVRALYTEVRVQNSLLTGYLTEYIQGAPLIQLHGREEAVQSRLHQFSQAKGKKDVRASFVEYAIGSSSFRLLSEVGVLMLVFFYCSGEIYAGTMTVGTMVMFIELLRQFFRPLEHLAETISTLQAALAAGSRISDLLQLPPAIKDEGEENIEALQNESFSFDEVSFAYGSEPVLHKLSFNISKGKMLAIVGGSGSGKSTCINLLLRFYDVETGCIRLGATDIKKIRPIALREHISLVLQEIYLFPGTIMQNLKAFHKDISDERVVEAAKKIGAHSFIMSLPNGYSTFLTERGANISYGERQLLSYTRALVKDPALLILDEATSSVDAVTERQLQESMKKLMQGRTTLVVAHRLSTIREADQIIVLEKGEIIEAGTHEALLAAKGKYWDLIRIQNGSKTK
jgi:ABC-type multidrug transport system fused ATPase/permease subunit